MTTNKERMPTTRKSVTHKGIIYSAKGRVKFFLIVGLYDDGRPGEVFVSCDAAAVEFFGHDRLSKELFEAAEIEAAEIVE
jgi:hypothetical protein